MKLNKKPDNLERNGNDRFIKNNLKILNMRNLFHGVVFFINIL